MTGERDEATTTDSPPPVDARELLVNDHRALEMLFARLEAPKGAGVDRADLTAKVIRDLSVHSGIERSSSTRPPATSSTTGTQRRKVPMA